MNAMTNIVNSTASGALTEAGNISTGSMGQIIIFFIGFAILLAIVGLVYKAFNSGKKG